jgi:hypothetical protein
MKRRNSFDVSIEYSLDEEWSTERSELHNSDESQNLVGDLLCYKLTDGEYIYLGCENQVF